MPCSVCGQMGHYKPTCPTAASGSVGSKSKPKSKAQAARAKPMARAAAVHVRGPVRGVPVPRSGLVSVPKGLSERQQREWVSEVQNGVSDSISTNARAGMNANLRLSQSNKMEDDGAACTDLMPEPSSLAGRHAVGVASWGLGGIMQALAAYRRAKKPKLPAGTLNPLLERGGYVKAVRVLDDKWVSGATYDAGDGVASIADYAGPLLDDTLPLVGYSITIVKAGGNIPRTYFDRMRLFLKTVIGPAGGKGCVGQEAGKRKGHLHLQCAMEVRMSLDDKGHVRLKRILMEEVLPHVNGRRCMIKPFGSVRSVRGAWGGHVKDIPWGLIDVSRNLYTYGMAEWRGG